jgi:hypothetical protein
LGNFKANENEYLNSLVADCVNFGLNEKESLTYIESRFGKQISPETYYRRKKSINSGNYAKEWINHFSKVGFLIKHKQIIEVIEGLQQDTLKEYLIEKNKSYEVKNKNEISKLRCEIRESAKLLQELYLGTPIIAQIKAKIENIEIYEPGRK